ncbi:hypothetical protein CWC18_10270 [Pseudoalteromonas aurantia]|uniref:Uncharacterized protein n=2 Tax=Pseudoalteromonas aurantia TaxID=43654 RepID=A0A5S3V719_9GAMM|nr:hypothetical protein CWC18_10270 [Pseudoalteromonas aurantia]TMO67540.1 hypothetical protein CWC19_13440 [Pseudoalteromonas aurantia]
MFTGSELIKYISVKCDFFEKSKLESSVVMAIVISSVLLFVLSVSVLMSAIVYKKTNLKRAGLFGLLVSFVLIGSSYYGDFWQMDGCLDSGGRYNETLKVCE